MRCDEKFDKLSCFALKVAVFGHIFSSKPATDSSELRCLSVFSEIVEVPVLAKSDGLCTHVLLTLVDVLTCDASSEHIAISKGKVIMGTQAILHACSS